MKHARAIVARQWPGVPIIPASKRLIYKPGRPPFSIGEDVLGVFDLVVVALGALIGIQVTSPKNAAARRHKVHDQLLAKHSPVYLESYVWAWHPGKHMATWWWDDIHTEWRRERDVVSPLLKETA
jgi:hypothetical protein